MTVLARLFIVVSSLAIAVTAFQVVVAFLGFSLGFGSMHADRRSQAVAIALLALSIFTLFVSVGLLRRSRWARPTFIVLMALGLLGHLFTLGVDRPRSATFPTEGPASYLRMLWFIRFLDIAYPIAACVLFAWIIIKLSSKAVRDEFR